MLKVLQKVSLVQYFKAHFGLFLLVIVCLTIFRKFDHDEFEAVHSSWKILNGERIYIDFFQHHHPFFYFLLAPVIWLFGESVETVLVIRFMMLTMYFVMFWCLFKLSKLLFEDERISWLSVLLLASTAMFSNKAIEIRPDVPQVLLGMLSILFLFQSVIERGKKKRVFLSAICLGISFLFLQKTIFTVAVVGLVQLYWVFNNEFSWSRLIQYWLLFGCVISPYFISLIVYDQLEIYLFFNWILNMHFEGGFSPFNTIIDSFYYNHLIWIFGILGFGVCFKKKRRSIVIFGVLLLATVFLVKFPYRQYFMPFVPVLCMMAAIGMFEFLKLKQMKWVVFLATVVPFVYFSMTLLVYPNKPQLDKINWVVANTNPSDYVYDGDIYFNLFRRDVDFFWYSTEPGKSGLKTYQSLKPYSYDVYKRIQEFKPKIISDTFIEDMSHEIISRNYRQSTEYPELYIRSGY
ncbi:ArnT family glycosyltransferase [Reichenbachiella sp.]|uniref:ArnT family glycosyltransferase n=1 Tax=Reichenbachiella sp. TaxID=2184521 RepID=UPI003B599788